jgi:hypothetical protein
VSFWTFSIKVGQEETGFEGGGIYGWFGIEIPMAAVLNMVMNPWIP